jgi:Ca-activated chloride channel family protein
MEVKIDEEMLQQVADMTGGKYFRATNNKALEQVYAEIDKLERSKIDVVEHNKREERFRIFGFIALALIALEFALRTTIFRSIP